MISAHIIKIASDTSNYGIKNKSNFLATSKNKICGDKITVELQIKKKIIEKMNYETESCIYCQASASLLSKSIKNKNINIIPVILKVSFKDKKFKKLLENKKRINCVMLPFDAMQKAFDKKK